MYVNSYKPTSHTCSVCLLNLNTIPQPFHQQVTYYSHTVVYMSRTYIGYLWYKDRMKVEGRQEVDRDI